MKHLITCICLMLASGLMAQSTPTSSSEARKVNLSKTNGKASLSNNTDKMTDSDENLVSKSDIGVEISAVDGGLVILGFALDNSMAKAAKLKVGDIITAINSMSVRTIDEFNSVIATHEPGDVVTVKYTRGERKLTKEVRINRK